MALISRDAARQPGKMASWESKKVSPQGSTIKSIRVLHVISDLAVGGAEMMLYKLLAGTNRAHFDPVVISLVDHGALRERIEALGITVHTTRMKPGRPTPLGLWRLIRLSRALKPDLVFGWMYHSCLAAELAQFFSRSRVPTLWSINCSIGSPA
jgi:hypothetical protein